MSIKKGGMMRFYYENNEGDYGVFSEKCLIKAIYTVWNIEGSLYKIPPNTKLTDIIHKDDGFELLDLVFAPWDDNEMNSELLEPYGYYMTDGEMYREIRRIEDDVEIKYDWSEVRRLV